MITVHTYIIKKKVIKSIIASYLHQCIVANVSEFKYYINSTLSFLLNACWIIILDQQNYLVIFLFFTYLSSNNMVNNQENSPEF